VAGRRDVFITPPQRDDKPKHVILSAAKNLESAMT